MPTYANQMEKINPTTRAGESREDRTRAHPEQAEGSVQSAPTRVSIVDATLVSPLDSATSAKLDVAGLIAIGTVLRGRYELEELLGSGSMGVVYRARDLLHDELRDANPFVAVKVLGEGFKNHPKALMALQRETRKAQMLAHENIVAVHNFDRDNEFVFMTMELLDGKSLRGIISERADGLSRDEADPMIRGMARALAYAHANRIVHCDLKPSNVFCTARQQIKVLDFGVARALPSRADRESGASADEGEVMGMTPEYASPQVIEGTDPAPSDDVFSLAIVAYELLVGRHPFDGRPATRSRLRQLRSRELQRLSRRQRRALMRALSAEREERYRDAAEFLADFEGSSRLKGIAYTSAAAALVFPISTYLLVSLGVSPRLDVPFDELPMDVQEQFNQSIVEGQTALGFGDVGLNDAFQYFSQAYALHPRNERAARGLESVADRLLAVIPAADEAAQRNAFTLLQCQSYLRSYPPVTSACGRFLGSDECASIAASCEAVNRN